MSRHSRPHVQLSLLSLPNTYFLGYLYHGLDNLFIHLCNNTGRHISILEDTLARG